MVARIGEYTKNNLNMNMLKNTFNCRHQMYKLYGM